MGFDVSNHTKMQKVECQNSLRKVVNSKKVASLRHKRSKSDSEKRIKEEKMDPSPKFFHHQKLDMGKAEGQTDNKKKPSAETEVQSSLKEEILQLEKRLHDQFGVRRALERSLGYRSSVADSSNDISMPKPTKELIREIAVLELEVTYLEQYLLSLYRKAFDQQQISNLSPTADGERTKQPFNCQSGLFQEVPRHNILSNGGNPSVQSSWKPWPKKLATIPVNEACAIGSQEKLTDPGVHRSQSSLSYRSVCSARMSPSAANITRALQACHSQPLSFLEHGHNTTSGVISLADYLGTSITDHVPETPNKISEDMVRCMGAIYCKLADPPLVHNGLSSSPASSFSSMSAFSPQYLVDMWSPGCKRESTLDSRLVNPFRVEGLKEFSGPYNAMVEVPSISKESQRLSDVEDMLQNYRSLVHRLESVNPRKMKNEEKLAFWINIHNALMMHAYLDYGIPQNNLKRASLLIKATYNIGGRIINADMIQSSILGCRAHRPGQWLRALFSSRIKFKAGDGWRAYAIEHPEPLLHFALCSGSYSDPAVRIYTSRRLFEELESAKEEYIRATVGIQKEQKIFLPKIIDSFAKDVSLSSEGVVDMIQCYLPETLRMAMQRCQRGRSHKIVEWVPHNFSFRYLLSRELTVSQINC